MSPSRIPRPEAGPQTSDPRSPGNANRSTPTSSAAPSGFKPNNPFAHRSLHPPSQSPPSQSPSPPARIHQLQPQSHVQTNRRPRPPAPEDDTSTLSPSQPRRPVPNVGSPDSVLPRPKGGNAFAPGTPRSCLRQPSTPALSIANRRAAPQRDSTSDRQNARPRAASAAADGRPCPLPIDHPPMPLLFEPSFADAREPSVPPHIRVRLRLIHQLGVVLGMDAQGISSRLDVPGLLARVDAAYNRCQSGSSGQGGVSSLPLPIRPVLEGPGQGLGGGSGTGMAVKGSKGGPGGMMGMIRRLGRKSLDEAGAGGPTAFSSTSAEGPAFGVALNEMPPRSWCTSLIGGQRHELPLIVFTVVEEIYRRGMSQPGIFRLAGDGTRISHLTKVFNLPPLYGDSLSISSEPIHNLTGLVKRYVRDLPEPILDESIFPAFLSFCAEHEPGALALPLATRITAAQILLKLLPPLHFSLFIYLLAFLGQLPLFPDNRLNIESISIIFGPAMCAARGKGISGLGPSTSGRGVEHDPENVSDLVNRSQSTLGWLLRNWAAISEKVLDPPLEDGDLAENGGKENKGDAKIDSKLLSPIDLRSSIDASPFVRSKAEASPSPASTQAVKTPASINISRHSSSSSTTAFSDTAGAESVRHTTNASVHGSGLFARALSSMSISSDAKAATDPMPKRSASFTSLSSLVRKGGVLMGKSAHPTKVSNDDSEETTKISVNPQITNVLGSLHDLLVSKDKQIERDARELALLRHTLLEMDEKLQRAASSPSSPLPAVVTPAITITPIPSTTTFHLTDLQTQLTTALAALETARLQSRKSAEKTLEVEARLARTDSENRLAMGKLEVALTLEQARVVGLVEERDLARDRLEKVKTTLFSVA